MGYWLAPPDAGRRDGVLMRFDPRYWTVDFPRPMMAGLVTTGPRGMRVECVFYRQDDLAGLIWESEDRHDHPLLRYETRRDYRRCRLAFRWRSGGVVALDQVHGPVLTIEGRDAEGAARTWLVRLWNYAVGSPEDAAVVLDFGDLAGGWEADDPVFAGDVDRMFVSVVPPGYTGEDAVLAAVAEGWVEVSDIACEGSGAVLARGDVLVPEHKMQIATGYDDLYHLTPERLLWQVLALGYRGAINHYVGMSHYFRLGLDGIVDAGGALNGPCAAWHVDFAARAKALGFDVIWSLSYELLDLHCPEAWKQRAADGAPALTGWEPPSALLSPAHGGAMAWLQSVAVAFVGIAQAAGLPVKFQVGEPWWWVTAGGDICLYDDAAVAAFAPVAIGDVRGALDATQLATLDAAGEILAGSTIDLVSAVLAVAPGAETLLLVYLPTVLGAPGIVRANMPVGWAAPAFDRLQLEDYDWAAAGSRGRSASGIAAAQARLGYPPEHQHYLAGFVLAPEDREQWHAIARAAEDGRARGVERVFLWALPQVLRDGFVWFEMGEDAVEAFADETFPLAIGREASVEPAFSTAIAETAGGAEQRGSQWADARLRFDAGPGVRGEEELGQLLAFFRARRGAAVAFRFRDPLDHSSAGMAGVPMATDQVLGIGDGARTDFGLRKLYGAADPQERRVTRPVAGSVRVALGGVEQLSGWTLLAGGVVSFAAPPAVGVEVRAGFQFDVPVRFEEDRLAVSLSTFCAGEVPSVRLMEVRE